MRKNKLIFISALFIALIMTAFWAIPNLANNSDSNSSPLPPFDLPTIASTAHLNNQALEGKVSLLNIWASWCSYCRIEHKMLLKIANNYHVPIFGVSYRDDPKQTEEWLTNNGNPYLLTAADVDGNFGNTLDIYGTPETLIIDKKGRVRYIQEGAIEENDWNNTMWPLIQQLRNEN